MVLENLDRTQWTFKEALAHVEAVVIAHRGAEASKLPQEPEPVRRPWERPVDPQVKWRAEAHEQLLVALRDGDLHAGSAFDPAQPLWMGSRQAMDPALRPSRAN